MSGVYSLSLFPYQYLFSILYFLVSSQRNKSKFKQRDIHTLEIPLTCQETFAKRYSSGDVHVFNIKSRQDRSQNTDKKSSTASNIQRYRNRSCGDEQGISPEQRLHTLFMLRLFGWHFVVHSAANDTDHTSATAEHGMLEKRNKQK